MPPLQVKPVPQFLMAHGSANKCERKSGMKRKGVNHIKNDIKYRMKEKMDYHMKS